MWWSQKKDALLKESVKITKTVKQNKCKKDLTLILTFILTLILMNSWVISTLDDSDGERSDSNIDMLVD